MPGVRKRRSCKQGNMAIPPVHVLVGRRERAPDAVQHAIAAAPYPSSAPGRDRRLVLPCRQTSIHQHRSPARNAGRTSGRNGWSLATMMCRGACSALRPGRGPSVTVGRSVAVFYPHISERQRRPSPEIPEAVLTPPAARFPERCHDFIRSNRKLPIYDFRSEDKPTGATESIQGRPPWRYQRRDRVCANAVMDFDEVVARSRTPLSGPISLDCAVDFRASIYLPATHKFQPQMKEESAVDKVVDPMRVAMFIAHMLPAHHPAEEDCIRSPCATGNEPGVPHSARGSASRSRRELGYRRPVFCAVHCRRTIILNFAPYWHACHRAATVRSACLSFCSRNSRSFIVRIRTG